ncbi:MAG: hypothetical protein ABI352_11045 [Candidatus Dormibacter sp.]
MTSVKRQLSGHGNAMGLTRVRVAAAASLLLAIAAMSYLVLGPVYVTGGGSCSSDAACVRYSGTAPLAWNSILVVPVVAAALVLAGAGLARRTGLSEAVTGLGCLGLAVVTFLGVFSIGMFLLPADVAACLALVWLRRRRSQV